jgi:hypothetical protein
MLAILSTVSSATLLHWSMVHLQMMDAHRRDRLMGYSSGASLMVCKWHPARYGQSPTGHSITSDEISRWHHVLRSRCGRVELSMSAGTYIPTWRMMAKVTKVGHSVSGSIRVDWIATMKTCIAGSGMYTIYSFCDSVLRLWREA